MTDLTAIDFFRDPSVVADPYPYFAAIREHGPIWREPYHDVVMVTGYDEAWAIYQDVETFSSCTSVSGPFPGFPVPLEGHADISDLIEQRRDELPMSDQIICFDPPKHTAHRALLMRLLTPKRLKENEDFMWRLADRQIDQFAERGSVEFLSEYAGPWRFVYTVGEATHVLAAAAREHDAWMIAVGSRRSGLGGWMNHLVGGSTAGRLAHTQSIPVTIVPQHPKESP